MSIDEVMGGVIEYVIQSRRATVSELRSFRTSIKAAIEQHVAEAVAKEREKWRPVLNAVVREMEHRDRYDGNAPGHGHEIPGIWDSDNGPIAGTECAWCATWKLARELVANDRARGQEVAK